MKSTLYNERANTIQVFINNLKPLYREEAIIKVCSGNVSETSIIEKRIVDLGFTEKTMRILNQIIGKSIQAPKIYFSMSIIMLSLSILLLAIMFFNKMFCILPFNSSSLFVASLCSLSLWVTNFIAKKDWEKRHVQKEKRR